METKNNAEKNYKRGIIIIVAIALLIPIGLLGKSMREKREASEQVPTPIATATTTPTPKPVETSVALVDSPAGTYVGVGESIVTSGCEVKIPENYEISIATFREDRAEDIEFLINNAWSLGFGDYLYVTFEVNKECEMFHPAWAKLVKGYDPFWGDYESWAWSNSWTEDDGTYRFLNIYKIEDGQTKFTVEFDNEVGIKFTATERI